MVFLHRFRYRLVCRVFLTIMFLILGCATSAMAASWSDRITGAPMQLPDNLLNNLLSPKVDTAKESGPRLQYAARKDAARIREWLMSEGFLDATVEVVRGEDGLLHWRVSAGDRWRIGEVHVKPEPPAATPLPTINDWFRSEDYERLKGTLLGAWVDAGYLQAKYATAAVYPERRNKTVRIVWIVAPGMRYSIGEIRITGARQYVPDLVRRLSLLQADEVPTRKAISEAIRRISGDSHYRSAAIIPHVEDASSGKATLEIQVVEEPRYSLSGQVGYSTDTGPEVGLSWKDLGLAQGKLEYGITGQWSSKLSGTGFSIARPVWPGRRDRTGVAVDYLSEDTEGQNFDTLSGGVFWQHMLSGSDFIQAELRQNWITGSGERLQLLEPSIKLHQDHHRGTGLPTGGWRADMRLAAPWQVNGSGRWLTFRADARSFHSWAGDLLLFSPRAGYGRSISLSEDVPKSLRQYAGGAKTVRGYELDSLGPQGADGLATGGLQAANVGIDVLLRLHERFMPVLFADAGQVWSTPVEREKLAWSLGLGVVSQTPIGPARIDVAVPMNRRSQDPSFQIYLFFGEVF